MRDLLKTIRDFVSSKKKNINPIFPNNAASLDWADDQKATADILQAMACNAVSNIGETAEDAAHLSKVGLLSQIREMLRLKAVNDAKTAEWDGEKWEGCNPSNAVVNAAKKFGYNNPEDDYQEFFDARCPEIQDCNSCSKSYTEKACPTCENRRFEADHSNL